MAQVTQPHSSHIAKLSTHNMLKNSSYRSKPTGSIVIYIEREKLGVFFLIVCFTSNFVFSCIAVLPHSPGVVYYHLLLRRETRFPGVAPFSFRIGIWDLFVHRGQKSYTPTAFGKLWTTPGVRCMQHASS